MVLLFFPDTGSSGSCSFTRVSLGNVRNVLPGVHSGVPPVVVEGPEGPPGIQIGGPGSAFPPVPRRGLNVTLLLVSTALLITSESESTTV